MHDLLVRFKLIKNNYVFEVILDCRLSFIDNFKLLQNIIKLDLKDAKVYDPNKRLFLDRNIPICEFNIQYFIYLYIF